MKSTVYGETNVAGIELVGRLPIWKDSHLPGNRGAVLQTASRHRLGCETGQDKNCPTGNVLRRGHESARCQTGCLHRGGEWMAK